MGWSARGRHVEIETGHSPYRLHVTSTSGEEDVLDTKSPHENEEDHR